ncbi:hypothetical protein BH747_07875 [Enterococcus villorum]|uniref:Uncharacterized protein n=1 Tax=Enterococcus villorum TaxID=112904 RepID=A0A1V8YBX5_9ENTE|nr:hypothetical protein [Enterococcus villorum]OQO70072.1 hypothetical protein BH747_07875 [Enterococcus villorum]OQO76287.1 hypothetical protein BH744_04205 [Enterococcus villorum]
MPMLEKRDRNILAILIAKDYKNVRNNPDQISFFRDLLIRSGAGEKKFLDASLGDTEKINELSNGTGKVIVNSYMETLIQNPFPHHLNSEELKIEIKKRKEEIDYFIKKVSELKNYGGNEVACEKFINEYKSIHLLYSDKKQMKKQIKMAQKKSIFYSRKEKCNKS